LTCRKGDPARRGRPSARSRRGADTADPDDLASDVGQLELLQQHSPVELHRVAIAVQEAAQRLVELVVLAVASTLMGTINGDWSTIRGWPSTSCVSFEKRGHAVAGARLCERLLVRLAMFGFRCERNSSIARSMS